MKLTSTPLLFLAVATIAVASITIPYATVDALTSQVSDSNISLVLSNARAAFTTQTSPTQITLDGQVRSIEGSLAEDGTAHLVAHLDGTYDIDLDLNGGPRTERQITEQGNLSCTWSRNDQEVHQAPVHNCMTRSAWFLPMLSFFGNSQSVVYSVLGSTERDSQSGIVLRQQADTTNIKQPDLFAHLSAFDLVISSQSYLPLAADYSIHPDDAANIDIPVEITYSDYQQVSGVSIPFHIQRFVNGTLSLDINIQTASIQ